LITYQEFLDEWIGLNRWQDEQGKIHSTPMTREEYYKLHMNGTTPRAFYEQLRKCKTFGEGDSTNTPTEEEKKNEQ